MLGLEYRIVKTVEVSTNIGDFKVDIFKDKCTKDFKCIANQISLIDIYGDHKIFTFQSVTPDVYRTHSITPNKNYYEQEHISTNIIEYKPLVYNFYFKVFFLTDIKHFLSKFEYELKTKNSGWHLTAVPKAGD